MSNAIILNFIGIFTFVSLKTVSFRILRKSGQDDDDEFFTCLRAKSASAIVRFIRWVQQTIEPY